MLQEMVLLGKCFREKTFFPVAADDDDDDFRDRLLRDLSACFRMESSLLLVLVLPTTEPIK